MKTISLNVFFGTVLETNPTNLNYEIFIQFVNSIAFVLVFHSKNTSKYSTIEYEAGACFGSCPIFKITINPDRTAVLEAEHFNFSKEFSKAEFSKPREGTFKGTIKQEDYDKLVALLDNLDVKI